MNQRSTFMWVVGALVVGAVVGYSLKTQATEPQANNKTTTSPSPTTQNTETNVKKPHAGWALHIDAEMHFPNEEKKIAHHYCKVVSGGLTECQLYDSDSESARLVGVETIIDTNTWKSLSDTEKANWHYHKEEIPKINATLPDLSQEEAAKVVKSIEETYGKVYILWDPSQNELPVGNPGITILK